MDNNMQVTSIKDLVPYINLFDDFSEYVTHSINSFEEHVKAKVEPVYFKYNNQDYVICSKHMLNAHVEMQHKKKATLTILENKGNYFSKIEYEKETTPPLTVFII